MKEKILVVIPAYKLFIEKKNNDKRFILFYIVLLMLVIISETGVLDSFYIIVSKWNPSFSLFVEFKKFIELLFFFVSGFMIGKYKNKIKINNLFLLICLLSIIIGSYLRINNYLFYVILPFITIVIGSFKIPIKIKPISYHIYIGGFAMQQLVMFYLYSHITFPLFILLSIIISILYGIFSYYFTEFLLRRRIK